MCEFIPLPQWLDDLYFFLGGLAYHFETTLAQPSWL